MTGDDRNRKGGEQICGLSQYAIDMSLFFPASAHLIYIAMPSKEMSRFCHRPTSIMLDALDSWNQYLATNDEQYLKNFTIQARRVIEHEIRIEDAGGWPVSASINRYGEKGRCLSASTQGLGLSVLLRAYQVTRDEAFFAAARRIVRTFERDILDGGINTPISSDGVFFEEVAVYPAAHVLSGCLFAIIGLYDYVSLTEEVQFKQLLHRCLATVLTIAHEFDLGFWTKTDLLGRNLASPPQLALQVALLKAVASYAEDAQFFALAERWHAYQEHVASRLHYRLTRSCTSLLSRLQEKVQSRFFPPTSNSTMHSVCVPLPAFPLTGGVLTVLEKVEQVTEQIWRMEYVTQCVGEDTKEYSIHQFGTARMTPSHFPQVWLYVLAGLRKLLSVMRRRGRYDIVLPQDGVFTAAFAALAAKIARVRVVCIDHGNLTLLRSREFRVERRQALARRHWLRRLIGRLQDLCYWPSLSLFARIVARLVDHFLIPGVKGDGIEETCQQLGVPTTRLTRFASMVDIERHIVLDDMEKASMREHDRLAPDAIIVAMICRLSPEKGVGIALESMEMALDALTPELRSRVCFIIAGDGPLRKEVEERASSDALRQTCILWGDIPAKKVISLLAISDIFLYTSTRGACFAMAVLEAMASGCAVIASTQPISNALLLAEERGIAIEPSNVQQTALALIKLLNNSELCRKMGRSAREYIAEQHSGTMFRRVLLRATYWSELDALLSENQQKGMEISQ